MTNRMAFVIGGLVVAALIADQQWGAGETTLFLLRKFAEFLEWLAFWR